MRCYFEFLGEIAFAEDQRYSSTVNCNWTIPGLSHDVALVCHSSVAPSHETCHATCYVMLAKF